MNEPPMQRTLSSVFVAAALSLSAPVVATAKPPPPPTNPSDADIERSNELFENGKGLYLDGSYDAAVAAFEQAYALSGDPLLLYNIALAHDRAGEYDKAIEYLEYYRAFAPAEESKEIAEKVESLHRRKIRAQAEEGEKKSGDGSSDSPAEEGGSADEGDTKSGSSSGGKQPADDRQAVFTPLAIGLTAGAVVAGGAGLGLGLASSSRNSDAESMCGTDPVLCPIEAEGDVTSSRRLALGADIMFGVAGAAAVAAIIVLAINGSKRKKQATAAARVGLTASRRNAALTVRF